MKAVMYHYVRLPDSRLPNFKYLHLDDFRRQLDHFQRTNRFIGQQEFNAILNGEPIPSDGIILTFDDGLSDHVALVLPELRVRGLWGIFYVTTGILSGELPMLDVHRVHLLLGAIDDTTLLKTLEAWVKPEMLTDLNRLEFREKPYIFQSNNDATVTFKRYLNYYLAPCWRTKALDHLFSVYSLDAELSAEYYCTPEDIKTLAHSEMMVGSHSVTHTVMSKLNAESQKREIDESFRIIDLLIGPNAGKRTFCFPYGGDESFNADTERLLREAQCDFAFSVEPRDIEPDDVRRRYALPRYDCSMLPFGSARTSYSEKSV